MNKIEVTEESKHKKMTRRFERLMERHEFNSSLAQSEIS